MPERPCSMCPVWRRCGVLESDRRLDELEALIVDCQATAASPGKGHLFELAWAGSSDHRIEGTLVRLPPGEKMPRRVTQLTGVSDQLLENSPVQWEAAGQLTERLCRWSDAVFIAHWARYERAWFEHLLGREVDWICTHEVAKRLLPGLPRKGLKAVAGYLGRPLDDAKRAGEHVEATLFVWHELVGLLSEEGVETLDELWRWLERPVPKTDERLYPLAREKRLSLPKSPGVYRMLNKNGRVLYVGKATSLKDRVNSYFRQRRLAHDKMELVTQVWDLDVTVTESALEAALLETDEIKRLAPPYNHALRGDGREVTWCASHDFRDTSTRRSATHTLGPFSSARTTQQFAEVLEFINVGGSLSWFGSASPEVLAAGRATFLAAHDIDGMDVVAMIELGRELYPIENVEDEEGPSVTAVTEQSVVEMLEWSVVSAYRSVERGAWLQRLSGGRIRWAPHGAPDERRELMLESAELASVDLYDRASVLLVELRRILRDGRAVEVVHADGATFDAARLSEELSRF